MDNQQQSPIPPSTPPVVASPPPFTNTYASFGRRLVAYLIDSLIASAFTTFFQFYAILPLLWGVLGTDRVFLSNIFGLMYFFFFYVYYVGFWVLTNGSSVGKYVVGVVIVSETNPHITALTASIRFFVSLFSSFLYIGYLLYWTNPKRQTLHDMAAKTTVMQTKKRHLIWGVLLAILLTFFVFFITMWGYLQFAKEMKISVKPPQKVSLPTPTPRPAKPYFLENNAYYFKGPVDMIVQEGTPSGILTTNAAIYDTTDLSGEYFVHILIYTKEQSSKYNSIKDFAIKQGFIREDLPSQKQEDIMVAEYPGLQLSHDSLGEKREVVITKIQDKYMYFMAPPEKSIQSLSPSQKKFYQEVFSSIAKSFRPNELPTTTPLSKPPKSSSGVR